MGDNYEARLKAVNDQAKEFKRINRVEQKRNAASLERERDGVKLSLDQVERAMDHLNPYFGTKRKMLEENRQIVRATISVKDELYQQLKAKPETDRTRISKLEKDLEDLRNKEKTMTEFLGVRGTCRLATEPDHVRPKAVEMLSVAGEHLSKASALVEGASRSLMSPAEFAAHLRLDDDSC